MASFGVHLACAGSASLAVAGICLQQGMVSQSEAVLLLAAGSLGGILPDVDSDHSLSVRMVFGVLGFAVAAGLMFGLLPRMPWGQALAWALCAALLLRVLVLPVFARLTAHRGVFHSLPAAMLAGLLTTTAALEVLHLRTSMAWLLGGFVSGGYVLHLMLDELYSIRWMRRQLKASFGTALTVFSMRDWLRYTALYLAVLGLWVTLPRPGVLLP